MRHSLIYLLLLFVGLASHARADPGSADIGKPLSVHGWCQGSKTLASECYGIWKNNIDLVRRMEIATKERNPKGAPIRECGKVHAQSKRLERLAGHLIEMGEPAGVDFLLRSNRMGWAAVKYAGVVGRTPEAMKIYTTSKKKMNRAAAARAKQIQSMQKRMPSQTVAVEKELYDTFEDIWAEVIFFSNEERAAVMKPYRSLVENHVAERVKVLRKKKNLEQLAACLKRHQPDIASLESALDSTAAALALGPNATLEGESCSGPEALAKLSQRWQVIHLGLIRCVGIDSAMRMVGRSYDDGGGFDGDSQSSDPWSQTVKQVAELMVTKLPELIAADATRSSGDEAKGLYLAYLQTLAPLCHRTGDSRFVAACQEPLAALASKSGPAGEFFEGYQKATNDILLWRQRKVNAQVRSRAKAYPSVTQIFKSANASDRSTQYVGLLPDPSASGIGTPTLRKGADEVLPVPITRIGTSKLSVRQLSWLPEYNLSCADLKDHTFASVPKVDVAKHVETLKNDLMITEDQPAFSLASAISSLSADANLFEAAGGSVHSIAMEAAIARYANLPIYFETLLPLNSLPGRAKGDEMLMRFNVLPDWVAHRHFFAQVKMTK